MSKHLTTAYIHITGHFRKSSLGLGAMPKQKKNNIFRIEGERRENEGKRGKSHTKGKNLHSLHTILDRSYEDLD